MRNVRFIKFNQKRFRDYYEMNDAESFRLYKDTCFNRNALSEEEQYELFKKVQDNNDADALGKLVINHQPIVILMSKRYAPEGMFMDYIDEANIALINAIKTFKYDQEVGDGVGKFFKYASVCIRNHFDVGIKYRFGEKISVSTHAHIVVKLNRFCDKFEQENQRQPTEDEKMEYLGSIGDTYGTHAKSFKYVSIEEKYNDDDGINYGIEFNASMTASDDDENKMEAKLTVESIVNKIELYQKTLIPESKEIKKFITAKNILYDAYGIDGHSLCAPTEIMTTYNLSKARYDFYMQYIINIIKKNIFNVN